MYYIVTALYCEAKPWIEKLGLTSVSDLHKLRAFRSDEAVLVVTGTGKLDAAIAVSELLSTMPPGSEDVLINAGICAAGSGAEIGSAYLCVRIEDAETGRQCYPDVISNPPVPQRCLLTVSKPYRGTAEDEGSGTIGTSANDRKDETCGEGAGILYDMEAYGVYAAASRWFGQHAMIFFKVVSDFGAKRTTGADGEDCEENRLTAESVSELMSGHIDTILAHAESVRNAITRVHAGKSGLSDAQKAKAEALAEEMYFSASMKREFLEILNYAELAWNEAGHILEEISAKLKEDPCGNKNDGKRYLALARQMTEQR